MNINIEKLIYCSKTKSKTLIIVTNTMLLFVAVLVGNVVDISATCHPDMCHSRIVDDIFNVAGTVTGSQSWSCVGKIPRHDICEASTKLVCRRRMSSSVTRGMVTLPTCQQTSSRHVATSAMVTRHVSKNGGLPTRHDTNISN